MSAWDVVGGAKFTAGRILSAPRAVDKFLQNRRVFTKVHSNEHY